MVEYESGKKLKVKLKFEDIELRWAILSDILFSHLEIRDSEVESNMKDSFCSVQSFDAGTNLVTCQGTAIQIWSRVKAQLDRLPT